MTSPVPRILGIDHGRKRIGLALSDPLGLTAQPLPPLTVGSEKAAVAELAGLIADRGISRVVVGLPLNMNGSEGEQARVARAFGEKIRRRGIEVVYWDERLSSAAAEKSLREAGLRRNRQKQRLDTAAAQLILSGYLEHFRHEQA